MCEGRRTSELLAPALHFGPNSLLAGGRRASEAAVCVQCAVRVRPPQRNPERQAARRLSPRPPALLLGNSHPHPTPHLNPTSPPILIQTWYVGNGRDTECSFSQLTISLCLFSPSSPLLLQRGSPWPTLSRSAAPPTSSCLPLLHALFFAISTGTLMLRCWFGVTVEAHTEGRNHRKVRNPIR